MGVRSQVNAQRTADFLSRRWDSNPRPVVYETVCGGAREYRNVHLVTLSCLMIPGGPSQYRLSAVRLSTQLTPQCVIPSALTAGKGGVSFGSVAPVTGPLGDPRRKAQPRVVPFSTSACKTRRSRNALYSRGICLRRKIRARVPATENAVPLRDRQRCNHRREGREQDKPDRSVHQAQ